MSDWSYTRTEQILPDEWLASCINVGFVGGFEVTSCVLRLVSSKGIVVKVDDVSIFYPWSAIASVEGP